MQSHSLEAALEPGFNTSKCGFNIFQDSSCSFACFPADCCRKDAFGWELLDFGSRCCSGSNPRPELVLRGSLRHPRPGASGSAQTTYRHRTNAPLSWVLGSASPSCSGTRCRGHCPDEDICLCRELGTARQRNTHTPWGPPRSAPCDLQNLSPSPNTRTYL